MGGGGGLEVLENQMSGHFQLGSTKSKKWENKACSFSSVFTSYEHPLSPFFLCFFLFLALDVVDWRPI